MSAAPRQRIPTRSPYPPDPRRPAPTPPKRETGQQVRGGKAVPGISTTRVKPGDYAVFHDGEQVGSLRGTANRARHPEDPVTYSHWTLRLKGHEPRRFHAQNMAKAAIVPLLAGHEGELPGEILDYVKPPLPPQPPVAPPILVGGSAPPVPQVSALVAPATSAHVIASVSAGTGVSPRVVVEARRLVEELRTVQRECLLLEQQLMALRDRGMAISVALGKVANRLEDQLPV